MVDFKIKLCAIDPELFHAWQDTFKGIDNVSVHLSNIFDVTADSLISPANSFGYMDGGIDQLYTDVFGPMLQKNVQDRIKKHYFGELPVGQAFIIDLPFQHKGFKKIIISPTMRVPEHIEGTLNAYYAFRAVLISILKYNLNMDYHDQIKSVVCPGLGTGIGRLSAKSCAHQMHAAYIQILESKVFPKSIFEAYEKHELLLKK